MKISLVAEFGPIVRDPDASRLVGIAHTPWMHNQPD